MKFSAIELLFKQYITAFEQQDIAATQQCYQLPCTLHTPDKAMLIANADEFTKEFTAIFTQLSHADIKSFKALSASATKVNHALVIVCVDWQFITSVGDVFTDFSAFYHLSLIENQWRIINVVSQELSQSIALDTELNLSV